MKKILIFGCGAIGIRHLQALETIGDFEMGAYRTRKGKKELPEKLMKNVKVFKYMEEAFDWKPDFIVISNPTSLHLEYLLKAIDHNVDALVEKPVASSYKEIEVVKDKIRRRNNNVYVGFNLRFHPVVREIHNIINSNIYGKPLKAELYVGEYLPFWHPYENYRTSYSARKKLGGGVLRTLCHEIDLGHYWFGIYDKVFSRVSKISNLDIDADDNTYIFAEMKNGALLSITMDYLNPILERRGRILFEKGLLEYSFSNMEIVFTDYIDRNTNTLLKIENYDYINQYKCQMEKCMNRSDEVICTLEEGINVTRIIDKCEESNKSERMLYV